MKPGDRITFVFVGTKTRLDQGNVAAAAVVPGFAFKLRNIPFRRLSFYTHAEDEGITWIRGWLRWWWPPDRRRARALLAAHALGDSHVVMTAERDIFDDAAKLQRDFDKIMRDLARSIPTDLFR